MPGVEIVYYCGECDYHKDHEGFATEKCHHGRFLSPGQWGRKIPNSYFVKPEEGEDNRPSWCPLF